VPSSCEGAVAEHREQDIGPASGEGDEGLVVPLPVSDLPVVIGARSGVAEGDARKPYTAASTVPTAHGLAAEAVGEPADERDDVREIPDSGCTDFRMRKPHLEA
jgi:hypothetical protein